MSNEIFKNTKQRIKHTAKLEKLILENADYSKILKESQIIDKLIANELNLRINKKIRT